MVLRLFLPLIPCISSAQNNSDAESFNHSIKQVRKLRQKYKDSKEQTREILLKIFRRKADFFLRNKVVSRSSVVPELVLSDLYVRRQVGCVQEIKNNLSREGTDTRTWNMVRNQKVTHTH